ncbi:hypothetical protein F3Y22_tig00111427pilonHSYRG00438 [Hibiscus syriacus]|uniref:RRM domain-containing protein n=1 Tax=Hibiscus syriacus TaxID=106335 RepID=A0A6A2XRU8_HIBSY|nr:hypothetical protein F3Y22_tig00111427pilonHSYRG00438 [Hibiscus syriacus]
MSSTDNNQEYPTPTPTEKMTVTLSTSSPSSSTSKLRKILGIPIQRSWSEPPEKSDVSGSSGDGLEDDDDEAEDEVDDYDFGHFDYGKSESLEPNMSRDDDSIILASTLGLNRVKLGKVPNKEKLRAGIESYTFQLPNLNPIYQGKKSQWTQSKSLRPSSPLSTAEVLLVTRMKFDRLKEEVNADLGVFAGDLVENLEKTSDTHPEWKVTLEDLLVVAQRCAKMPACEFWVKCEGIVQNLDDRRQELSMGVPKQLHTRLLFILTRCTRLVQFHKESGDEENHILELHQFSDLGVYPEQMYEYGRQDISNQVSDGKTEGEKQMKKPQGKEKSKQEHVGQNLSSAHVTAEVDTAKSADSASSSYRMSSWKKLPSAVDRNQREKLKGKSVPDECWSAFIDNLSRRVSRRMLRELFLVHGLVMRVFIPSQIRNPKYRFSTFAFVHFKREEDLKRVVDEFNGVVIDGRKISVSPARFKDERSRSRVVLSSSNKAAGQINAESSKSRERENINRSRRDDRTYRDALLSNGNRRGNNDLLSEDIQRRNVKKNIFEMHIPSESANWVKRSLTGIIKYSFQVEFIRNALLKEGYDVQIARWGYVWNSYVIVLKSHEEMLELWSNKEEVLKQWFERVEPLLNETGVPMAFCMAELKRVPLLCWNESFFEKLADVITLGLYGRSFKVSIKIGSASEYSSSFFSNFPVEDSGEIFFEESMSEKDEDRLLSDHGEGETCAAGKNRLSVDNWIDQGVFRVSGGASEDRQLARLSLDRKDIKCGLSESQTVGNFKVGEYAGLGIRSQNYSADGSQAHSEDSGQSGSKDFSGFISGPAFTINKFGELVENLHLSGKNREVSNVLETSPIVEKPVSVEIEPEEENLRPVELVSTNLGFNSRGRSRERRYWYEDLLNISSETGGTIVKQRELDVDSSTKNQLCLSAEHIADRSLIPRLDNGSGGGSVEREIEGYFSEGECLRSKSGLLIKRKRRTKRILYREALDQVFFRRSGINKLKGVLESPSVGSAGGPVVLCGFINVYGPAVEEEKSGFFEELSSFLSGQNYPVCVGGDFNVYLQEDEKMGRGQSRSSMEIFNEFILHTGLIDLPMNGELFPGILQSLLPSSLSDHNAIVLENKGVEWGRKPFRLFNYLMDEEGFEDLIVSSIQSGKDSQKKAGVFSLMRNTKHAIKKWSGNRDKYPGALISELEKKISLIENDIQQKQGVVDSEVLTELKNFRAELWKLHKIQKQIWFQYSRTNWIEDGNRNTKYFHTCATIKNKRNALLALNFKGKQIYLEQNQFLEQEFYEEEVWDVVKSCSSNKAPGPDGFNLGFSRGFGRSLRPISLVGGLYKILSKCLSRRLRSCISDLISPSQFAFIPGRQILDCSLIANKGIDFWRKNGLKVLVNGVPTEEIPMAKGLRQGCSLSPLVFNIVVELLNLLILKAVSGGLFSGLVIRKEERNFNLTHLQFVDDLIMFCGASKKQILNVKWVLRVFEIISGLQLNLKKCKLFGVNLKKEEIKDWAAMIGCSVGSFPSEYLGLPLGLHRNSNILWDPVVQSFNKRLAGWKYFSLSLAGKLVLIKSVLSSLPIYFLSMFKVPALVYKTLNSIMSNFLWGGGDGNKKIHWVSWSDVCKPKIEGGLGVPNLNVVNRALLEKWAWRFAIERKAVWREMLCIKYKLDPSLMQFDSKVSPKFSWMWRAMVSNHYKADSLGCSIRGKYSYKIDNGRNIRFWKDNWAMDHPLMVLFARLFSIAVNKTGRLFQFGEFSSGGWLWNVQLRRELNDWEFEQWANLMVVISDFSISADAADGLFWKGTGEGVFTVKSCVNLSYSGSPDSEEAKFWKFIVWRGLLPPRVETFLWQVILKKLAVKATLWIPTRPILIGFIKLNVDAATSSDWKRSGLDGILKDMSGSILGSFKEPAGPGPPTLMELKAILKGLDFYESIRHRFKDRLIIESDSKVAIGWVKDVVSCPVVYVQIVKDIIQKLSVYEGFISWVSRTANIEADVLGKAGIG